MVAEGTSTVARPLERERKKALRRRLEHERRVWLQQLESMRRWLERHRSENSV
jgi:hypothetical protein